MTDHYKRWQPAEAKVQALQQGGLGSLVKASGELKDDIVDRYQEAGTAGYPDLAPADALPWIGKERMLPRMPGESEAAYRERLRLAWETWREAGTIPGMLKALDRLGLPAAGELYLIEEGGKYSYLLSSTVTLGSLMVQRHTSRSGWWFDGETLNTRFALLFDTDHATVDPGSASGPASIASLVETVNTWRPASATFYGIYVILAGTHFLGWPTTQVLGGSVFNLGGNSMRTIFPNGTSQVLGP